MFKYTKAAVDIIIGDVKRYCNLFKYGSMIFTIAYLVYALVMKTGNLVINGVLLGLFVLYIFLDFITNKKDFKLLKKFVKRSYKGIKFTNKTFSLGVMIYGIFLASSNASGISIILATLMIITWVLQALLELIIMIFEDKKDLLVEGFNKDIENIKKPVTTVNNFIKRVKGEEIEEERPITKNIKILEKRINQDKREKCLNK